MVVAKELFGNRIVGHKNIGPTITIEIVDRNSESFTRRVRDPAFLGGIGKRAVAIIVKYQVGDGIELVGMTVFAVAGLVLAAIDICAEIPLHITADHQIEMTVTVIVDKARARAPPVAANACPGGVITFDPAINGQTLVLTSGELFIHTNLSIVGPGPERFAISGNGSQRVFSIGPGVTSFLAGCCGTSDSSNEDRIYPEPPRAASDREVLRRSRKTNRATHHCRSRIPRHRQPWTLADIFRWCGLIPA